MNGNADGIRDSVVFLNDDIFISLYLTMISLFLFIYGNVRTVNYV